MGLFFGTDGLRGKVNEDLTFDIAYKIGNGSYVGISSSNLALSLGSSEKQFVKKI